MLNLLLRTIIILTIFYSSNLSGLEPYEYDLELSKKSFLISGVDFKEKAKGNGVMTLCFKTQKDLLGLFAYEHAALVFEMFFPRSPKKVSVSMIQYSGDVKGSNIQPSIDSHHTALIKSYRGYLYNQCTGEKLYRPTQCVRYASWALPNKDLLKAYTLALNDADAHAKDRSLSGSYSSISYVTRIMEKAGLTDTNFGCWRENSDNLKILVNQYTTPKPHRTQYDEITVPMIQ